MDIAQKREPELGFDLAQDLEALEGIIGPAARVHLGLLHLAVEVQPFVSELHLLLELFALQADLGDIEEF